MKNALFSLIENPSLSKQMGEFNRKRALECFTGQRMIRELENLYNQCIQ